MPGGRIFREAAEAALKKQNPSVGHQEAVRAAATTEKAPDG
jgi:hypothetical protein